VRDAVSKVDRLEVVEGDEVRFLASPEDGVCDSTEERFTVALPSGVSPSGWSVRAVDDAGNAAEQGL
jgi:hypothetical protein